MINKYLFIAAGIFSFLIAIILFPEGVMGLLICTALAAGIIHLIRIKIPDIKTQTFLINIFIAALLARVLLAVIIYGFDLQTNFGPDARFYDQVGNDLANSWWGQNVAVDIKYDSSGWGMPYFVGAIYFISEHNPLAGQLIEAVLGAVTAILAYFCSQEIFENTRVARYTAIFIAFFPAMVIWTSQLLKDGFIIFFLILALLSAIHLQKRFSYVWVIYLLISLLAISTLRFYIFFMLIAAVIGGFVLSAGSSAKNLFSRFIICSIIGVAFMYLGVWKLSEQQATTYVSLDRIQASRAYASSDEAKSAIKDDTDVSTTSGLITALPMGMLNLYLAPFPWQVSSITQVMTMPEMILWWGSLPFLLSGIFYAVRQRFRQCISLLFFTLILSLSYAVYQGNIGTLYRQRAQLQVILLLFTAVGVALRLEKKEIKIVKRRNRKIR